MNKKIFIKILILQLLFVSGFYFLPKIVVAAAPTVSSFSPIDNDTYVASSTDLTIVFSENVFVDSGNIYIKKSADDSVFETIDVASDQVTISGATTTISLGSLLERGVAYYVQIDNTCFKNGGEEYYIGISDTTTWDFIVRNDLYVTELVKDINSGSGDSSTYYFTAMNNEVYFRANDGVNDHELWKSDGTASGTVMVKDINESGNSSLEYLTVMNNEIYFAANDGTNGVEFWKSDGTASGTVMVKDINGLGHSSPAYLTLMNNEIYFAANDGVNDYELWKSDGTASGTAMVKDVNESGNSSLEYLTVMNNEIYFAANDGVNGYELWKSDGTASGTVMVKDVNESGNSSPEYLIVMNNEVYFQATDGVNGIELWKSDGTASGTVMVKDINESGNSSPRDFTLMNNEVYFRATDGVNGYELWKSDGTASGTVMVKDINESGSSYPNSFASINNEIYFTAKDGVNGYEFWKTDGTASGTVMVKDINGLGASSPYYLIIMNNEIYFQASNGINGDELWKSDGTAIGTVMVRDINESGNSSPEDLTVVNNEIYFRADDGTNGKELWKMYIITSPVVVSDSSTSISTTTAVLSGEIQSIGRQNNSERGFVWSSSSQTPTVDDSSISETGSFDTGSFSATSTGLTCATTYYFRAYSVNRAGASYGDSVPFTTSDCPVEIPTGTSLPPGMFLPPQELVEIIEEDGIEIEKIRKFRVRVNNGNKQTSNKKVRLELIAGPDTVNMAISEDLDFEGVSIEPFQKNKEYVFSDEEGEKTIYVKFYTKWGYSSEPVSASIYYGEENDEDEGSDNEEVSGEQVDEEETVVEKITNVPSGLSGKVLFQNKNNNEIWYVNPENEKKYSITSPLKMFNIMSHLSLGVVHEYITKYVEFPKRVLGRILLDVEDYGKAYYVNPTDKKKYYLGRPKDAFDIMKSFGIRISNNDIEKIETGEVALN